MSSISQATAETLNTVSNAGLIFGAVLALTGTLGTFFTSQILNRYADERAQRNERATAEANARAADAGLKAAQLEQATEGLKQESEMAKAEAERLKLRLLELQKIRSLSQKQIGALTEYFQSPAFRADPKVNLGIGAVADAEAQVFAMEFLRLFQSCPVDFYPCPGGNSPREIVQIADSEYGLSLSVHSLEITPESQPFTLLQRLMFEIGLPTTVEVSKHLGPWKAQINVLRKPAV